MVPVGEIDRRTKGESEQEAAAMPESKNGPEAEGEARKGVTNLPNT